MLPDLTITASLMLCSLNGNNGMIMQKIAGPISISNFLPTNSQSGKLNKPGRPARWQAPPAGCHAPRGHVKALCCRPAPGAPPPPPTPALAYLILYSSLGIYSQEGLDYQPDHHDIKQTPSMTAYSRKKHPFSHRASEGTPLGKASIEDAMVTV